MSRRRYLMPVAAPLLVLSGCLTLDAKLDAGRAGSMTVSYVMEQSSLAPARKQMEGPHVTVKSAEWKDGRGTFTLTFDDVEKLPTSKFFERAAIKLANGDPGTKELTVTIRNPKPMKVAPDVVAQIGKEAHLSVELQGEIVSSNATSANGTVATWIFPTEDFAGKLELLLRVSFKAG
jgi:hypothetical protein